MRCVLAIAVAVVALSCAQFALASSSGALSYCDLTRRYGKGTTIMPWVQPVQNATFYTIRSGDAQPSQDTKYYTAGELTPIHIRVLDLNRIYIGMVLYAVDKNGTQVGTWTVTTGLPFWTPPSCLGKSVTHSDADLKPIHAVFFFSAPAGTGPVTFKIMIKQGEQNKGNFYYPAKVLTLMEKATPNYTSIVQALPGQSCAAACAGQPTLQYCDAILTAQIASTAVMTWAAGISSAACTLPILSGCSVMAPFHQLSTDYCYYHAPNCSSRIGSTQVPNYSPCYGSDMQAERLCACSESAAAATGDGQTSGNPYASTAGGQDGLSGNTATHANTASSVTIIAAALVAIVLAL